MPHRKNTRTVPVENRRNHERVPVLVEAKFQEQGSFRTEVYLLDLSQAGCRFESTLRVRPGQRVWITLDGADPREAFVRWSDPGQMGAEFVEPVDGELVDRLRACDRIGGGGFDRPGR